MPLEKRFSVEVQKMKRWDIQRSENSHGGPLAWKVAGQLVRRKVTKKRKAGMRDILAREGFLAYIEAIPRMEPQLGGRLPVNALVFMFLEGGQD